MANRDGNGWTTCGQGHRHWGRFGAAGLLAFAPDQGQTCVLLQRRSWWGNHGGTWGPPGGARDSHESAVTAALREAEEECAMPPDAVSVTGIFRDDHGGWSYQTVIASAPRPFPVRAMSSETSQVSWVPEEDVAALDLHPGFAERWPVLRAALQPLSIIVDGANVMGSRPDGWWRDRAGARDGCAISWPAGRRRRPALPEDDAARPRWNAGSPNSCWSWKVRRARSPPRTRRPHVAQAHVTRAARDTGACRGVTRAHVTRVRVTRVRVRPSSCPAGWPDPGRCGPWIGRRHDRRAGPGSAGPPAGGDRRQGAARRCMAAGASVTGPGWLLGQL